MRNGMGDMNSSLAYSVAFHSIILICGVHLRLSHVVEVVDNDEVDTMLEASPTAARKASAREDRRTRSEIRDAGSRIRVAR